MTTKLTAISTLAVSACLLAAAPAAANLIDTSVRFQCLNCGPPTDDTFTVVKGGPPELTLFDSIIIDVEANTLRIAWDFESTRIINGIELLLSDLSETLTGASINQVSTYAIGDELIVTPSSVLLIGTDESVAVGDFVLIDLEFGQVSAPPVLGLFGLALIGGTLLRRGKNSCG
ncbi:hypothetical protein KCG44_09570 [Pacificimonas sp. WHA3]|uniref:PEP-CTERM sorting domain-containing protein n=1 Tax=Pacificimonas pallii TaxID=2827236 RepID=A0ABS6SF48_9SPHN|nr:hypothetical protein [Pacificimonas pallii]MBV7257030.1 hypothetical protein [Pacificimonas pallii]